MNSHSATYTFRNREQENPLHYDYSGRNAINYAPGYMISSDPYITVVPNSLNPGAFVGKSLIHSNFDDYKAFHKTRYRFSIWHGILY